METIRKPLQGTINILRFNWHFYLIAAILIFSSWWVFAHIINYPIIATLLVITIALPALVSVLVSTYVYDLSGFYSFNWLNAEIPKDGLIVNIHAGFDETSEVLKNKYPGAQLFVYDFYDPGEHTEISIKRARKAYPPFPGTQKISTISIPMEAGTADHVFLIFAAHEIRSEEERILFFKELKRILKNSGTITIVEHLRDLPNFMAYNIGYLHFLKSNTWLKNFHLSGLELLTTEKINPFLTQFTLRKNGTAS